MRLSTRPPVGCGCSKTPRPPPCERMAGYKNDGNFLAKFQMMQQKLGLAPQSAAAVQPEQSSQNLIAPPPVYSPPVVHQPVQHQVQPAWGAQQHTGWGAAARPAWAVPPPPQQAVQTRDFATKPWQLQPQASAGQQQQKQQQQQRTALATPQTKAEKLAAAGWRKMETLEGSYWCNDVTGETTGSEPALPVVMLVQQRTGGATSRPSPSLSPPHPSSASHSSSSSGIAAANSGPVAAAVKTQKAPPPPPPPPGVSKQAAVVMDKLAVRVATHGEGRVRSPENGAKFEEMLKAKNAGDPTFSFLFHVGSVGHAYYETLKCFRRELAGGVEEKPKPKRKRVWGPPADGIERGNSVPPEPALAPPPQAVAPDAPKINWSGVPIGTAAEGGWRQYTLVGGRPYYRRAEGAFVETVWERPVAANYTGAWQYNRPCAQQYVGKYQLCMVTSGRLIRHEPVQLFVKTQTLPSRSCSIITRDAQKQKGRQRSEWWAGRLSDTTPNKL
eukprot:COSAG05_NODE_665_length_8009_cov_156.415929_6_plen_499_part_00